MAIWSGIVHGFSLGVAHAAAIFDSSFFAGCKKELTGNGALFGVASMVVWVMFIAAELGVRRVLLEP